MTCRFSATLSPRLPLGRSLLLLLLGFCAVPAPAVELCWIFSSGMVLQADRPVPVWGRAVPSEEVTVSFAGQTKSAKADAHGNWAIQLDPLPPSASPRTMHLHGSIEDRKSEIDNILVGDVWLCAGQSNMMQPELGQAKDGAAEAAGAEAPLLRRFQVPNIWAAEPQRDNFPGKRITNWYTWIPCTPDTARRWAAVQYFFGRAVQRETGRPIGLLSVALGASSAEAWVPAGALAAEPRFAEFAANSRRWIAGAEAAREAHHRRVADWEQRKREAENRGAAFSERRPSDIAPETFPRWWAGVLYNAMVAPLRNFAVRGVIWYQGENNAARHAGCAGDRDGYTQLMTLLIGEWRRIFEQPELPFYQVQLANMWKPDSDPNALSTWAEIREAQARVAVTVPHTGLAVAIDIGEADNIHPVNKRPVGERLARLALRDVYGKAVLADGPEYASHAIDGNRIRVRFRRAAGGLRSSAGESLTAFAVAGEDRRFGWAEARIEGDEVVVWSPQVARPVAVRYAFGNNPAASLYNGEGLPAGSFRTDDWPLPQPEKKP
jgi:sialate O-acetylesterase